MAKKNKFGPAPDKMEAVLAWLNEHPTATNRMIADEVGCSISYVYMIRRRMAHVPACTEQVEEVSPAFTGVITPPPARNIQMGGDHYKGKPVQPWDVYDTWPAQQRIGAYRANCAKYVMRMDDKDTPLLNAQKLAHYAQKLVEVLTELDKEEG